MKKSMPILVVVLCLVSVAGISMTVSATKKKNVAETEAQTLRAQLAELQKGGKPREPRTPIEPIKVTPLSTIDTNDLVALQGSLAERDAELERLWAELEKGKGKDRKQKDKIPFSERMAQMQLEDPEGYAEMIARREEFQQRIKYEMAERASLLVDMDTAGMTEEELAAHGELVDRMGKIFELTEAMQNPEGGSNREVMHELSKNIHEARPLMEQQRTVILRQMGDSMGLNQQESQNLATYVENIYSATSLKMPGGSHGKGGKGGGGRGGRGGGK